MIAGIGERGLQLVVFLLGGQRYGLPLACVERVLPMVAVAPLPNAPAVALGVINLHGQVIPVVDLRRRLGWAASEYSLAEQLIVARTPRRRLAFPVDEVRGVDGVRPDAVMPASALLPGIAHVTGIVPLAGGLLFIQDLDGFLSLDEEAQLTESLRERPG